MDTIASTSAEIGDRAADWELTSVENETVRLATCWRDRPTVVVFLRHLGCVFCREQVMRLRRDYKQIAEHGNIVCIAQGDYQTGKAFSILFETPFPMLMCGSDLGVYKAYGLVRGNLGQLFGPKPFIRALRALLSGSTQGRIVGDGFQMPGTFVVDRDGILRLVHRHKDVSDHIETSLLIDTLRGLS